MAEEGQKPNEKKPEMQPGLFRKVISREITLKDWVKEGLKKHLKLIIIILLLLTTIVYVVKNYGAKILNILPGINIGASDDIASIIHDKNKTRANELLEEEINGVPLAEILVNLKDAEEQLKKINDSGLLESADGINALGGQIDVEETKELIKAAKKSAKGGLEELNSYDITMGYILGNKKYAEDYIQMYKNDCFKKSARIVLDYAIQTAIDKYNAESNEEYRVANYKWNDDYTLSVTLQNGRTYEQPISLAHELQTLINIRDGNGLDDESINNIYNRIAKVLEKDYEIDGNEITATHLLISNRAIDPIKICLASLKQKDLLKEITTKYTSGTNNLVKSHITNKQDQQPPQAVLIETKKPLHSLENGETVTLGSNGESFTFKQSEVGITLTGYTLLDGRNSSLPSLEQPNQNDVEVAQKLKYSYNWKDNTSKQKLPNTSSRSRYEDKLPKRLIRTFPVTDKHRRINY